MPTVVIFFVDSREVRFINLPENVVSPYGALCNAVAGLGGMPFRLMWADEGRNVLPILSDRSVLEALHSRPDPRVPLRIFVKGNRKIHGFNGDPSSPTRVDPLLGHRPRPEENMAMRDAAGTNRGKINGPRVAEELWKAASARAWRPAPAVRAVKNQHMDSKVNGGFNAIMPKDPSLAELVETVRRSLDSALSNLCIRTPPCASPRISVDRELVESTLVAESVVPVPEKVLSLKEECVMPQRLEVTKDILEEPREMDSPRAVSVASEEFMIPTFREDSFVIPAPEFCPGYSNNDIEAALSEVASEDAFEIVDAPDEWDSDVEWTTEWNAMDAASISASYGR